MGEPRGWAMGARNAIVAGGNGRSTAQFGEPQRPLANHTTQQDAEHDDRGEREPLARKPRGIHGHASGE
jgi:hypothetical protein